MRIQSLVLTLMVTLAEGMARWVQSWVQVLTSFPPKANRAWESDALPSLSKHEEHTTGFWWPTLRRNSDNDLVIKNKLMVLWYKTQMTKSCFSFIPEFAVKNAKRNTVSWLQAHWRVLCQALAVDKRTILGGVFQSQGLGIKFRRAIHEIVSQTNHPTLFLFNYSCLSEKPIL